MKAYTASAPPRHTCGRDGIDGCLVCRDRILKSVASQRRGSAGRALNLAEANAILANARNPYYHARAKAFDEYAIEKEIRRRRVWTLLAIVAGVFVFAIVTGLVRRWF